ncbi:hypothetical protein D6C88_05766 [Aureobasidium pullulans]|nr:hypothetical protein D6C88_05766 [Aureobasidium pullulans]
MTFRFASKVVSPEHGPANEAHADGWLFLVKARPLEVGPIHDLQLCGAAISVPVKTQEGCATQAHRDTRQQGGSWHPNRSDPKPPLDPVRESSSDKHGYHQPQTEPQRHTHPPPQAPSTSRRHDSTSCPRNVSLSLDPDDSTTSAPNQRAPTTENALLAQVPLTVSPFVTLPKAPTLPHNYASIPSTLPPSILNTDSDDPSAPPTYVTSGTGFRAHPSTIITQNKALRDQLDTAASDSRKKIHDWRQAIDERELAEKRRKAPGWLDSDAKILRPATTVPPPDTKPGASLLDADEQNTDALRPQESANDMGSQMDRAFG